MIKRISFLDILLLEPFKDKTIFDLLHPSMDHVVAPYCFLLGADIDKPVVVQACKHRRLNGDIATSYCYVYYERMDKEWIDGPYSTMSARIERNKDLSLKIELCSMCEEVPSEAASSSGIMFDNIEQKRTRRKEILDLEPDAEAVSNTISALQAIQIDVRGPLIVDELMMLIEEEEGNSENIVEIV